jgi:acetylornithine deacetylase
MQNRRMTMPLDPVDTLAQLVAIPSVNPMGESSQESVQAEARVTDHLEELFRSLGLSYQRQMVEPGRENIVAILIGEIPPDQGGEIILLDAHQDTVPVTGMKIPPWEPSVRDGCLYGRGSCDVKGGMAHAFGNLPPG